MSFTQIETETQLFDTEQKIIPSRQPLYPEGAHAVGADVRKFQPLWEETHPGEPFTAVHIGEPGEPFGDPMRKVQEALRKASFEPESYDYDDPAGHAPFREAIAGHTNRRALYPFEVSPDDVIVTPGSKEAAYLTMRALIDQGDTVAISELAYPGHYAAVLMNYGSLVGMQVNTANNLHHDPEQTQQVLSAYEPKVIITCNPSNPAGLVYTKEEAKPIIVYLITHPEAVLIQDVIYKDLAYPDDPDDYVIFSQVPEIAQRVISLDGASKGPRATGFRMGWALVPHSQPALREYLVGEANAIFAGTAKILARALIPAFQTEGDADIAGFRQSLIVKRDLVIPLLNKLPGVRTNMPNGAFYVMLDIADTGMDAERFYRFALNEGVSMIPGKYFGSDAPDIKGDPLLRESISSHVLRWTFGASLEAQLAGIERLRTALAR